MTWFSDRSCTVDHHNFGTRFFWFLHKTSVPTNETRIYTEPLKGRGAGKGSWRITQRKFHTHVSCMCGRRRIDCGFFWKAEKKEFIPSS